MIKKKKKSSENKVMEHLMVYGWAYLVMIMAIGALWHFGVFNGEFNPDKEICYYNSPLSGEILISETDCKGTIVTQFGSTRVTRRDKTKEELEIDYCKSNYNDETRCVCVIRSPLHITNCLETRPKTEIEKLKDKSCIVLFNHLGLPTSIDNRIDLLRTWREKGCKI